VSADQVRRVEESDAAYADANLSQIADLYGVNLDWLSGHGDLRDYAAIRNLPGADNLPFADRDMLAELFASRSRGTQR